jgi:KaiC/GvpD/RAD55 family RecA-like ATPase
MAEKTLIERSPVRIFDRAIGGGLGAGNIGVVLSRNGVGKTGFLIGLAIDQLLQGRKVLYISTKESVEHINRFFDHVFHAMAEELDMQERPQRQLLMERGRHILVYNRDLFSVEKLEQSVAFLEEAAGFTPDMVIMDGTPRFEKTEKWEIEAIRKLAAAWAAEVWTTAVLHREDQQTDDRSVPLEVARFDEDLGVIIHLCPDGDQIRVRITKEHGNEVAEVPMHMDPRTLMLRWR